MGYDFAARTWFDRVFTGLHIQMPAAMLTDAAAVNAVYESSDTLDADYERLLFAVLWKMYGAPNGGNTGVDARTSGEVLAACRGKAA